MKTIRISVETWRAVNGERRSPSETFDGAIRRRLKMADGGPEIPDGVMIHVSNEVHRQLVELRETDESFDAILGELFGVDFSVD